MALQVRFTNPARLQVRVVALPGTTNVVSVFGRDGVVVAQGGDYVANDITYTPSGILTATNVQSAIDELAAGGGITPAALSSGNDTNITLTLGGTPNTALLQATSITAGWTGTLAMSRGGLGTTTLTSNAVLIGAGTGTIVPIAPGGTNTVLTSAAGSTGSPTWQPVLGYSNGIINGSLDVSATGGSLTITLNSAAGTAPTSSNPVKVTFRSGTATIGTPTTIDITGTTTFTIPSGASLGVATATAFRLWIVGFNDAGTFRLGAVNCSSASSTGAQVFNLLEGLRSSTSTVGNSAGTIYTGTGVTLKAMRVIGFAEWNSSGLTSSTTWTTTNLALIQLDSPSIPKPGWPVQSVFFLDTTAKTTTSSTYADTSSTITLSATSAANLFKIETSGILDSGASNAVATARIHRGSTAIAHEMTAVAVAGGETQLGVASSCYDKPNTTSATQYVVKVKSENNSTLCIWAPGTRGAQITVTEVMG